MGIVVACRPDGLGTRLMTLLCARLLAEKLEYGLQFMWPSLTDNHYVYTAQLLQEESFADVFSSTSVFSDTDPDFGRLVDSETLRDRRVFSLVGAYGSEYGSGLHATTRDFIEQSSRYDVVLYDRPTVLEFRDRANDGGDHSRVKEYWRKINFNHSVVKAFQSFSQSCDLPNIPAIHVRRGDIAAMIHSADFNFLRTNGVHIVFQRYLPLQTVFDIISRDFVDRSDIVVCSESRDVVMSLRERFPHIKFHSSAGIFPEHSSKEALLDLMILSGAKELISPFKSFYSECASFVGTCEIYRAELDVFNLVKELSEIIDRSLAPNKPALKALVMVVGWQNLGRLGDSPERARLLITARELDSTLVDELLTPGVSK